MAWVGLAADVVSLAVPCVTGGGAIVKTITKADDVVDAAKTVNNAAKTVDKVNDARKIAKTAEKVNNVNNVVSSSTKSARSSAVRRAWKMEYDNVKNGGDGLSRVWSISEKIELLQNGKIKGYYGHHMKSVKGYPDLAGDPYNIQFLKYAQHLAAHYGNWRNITHGRYYY